MEIHRWTLSIHRISGSRWFPGHLILTSHTILIYIYINARIISVEVEPITSSQVDGDRQVSQIFQRSMTGAVVTTRILPQMPLIAVVSEWLDQVSTLRVGYHGPCQFVCGNRDPLPHRNFQNLYYDTSKIIVDQNWYHRMNLCGGDLWK